MIDYDEDWWPDSNEWPSASGTWEDNTWKLFTDQAMALLILNEDISFFNNDGKPAPMVICNDVFAWGCADCEDLPLIGWHDEQEEIFWDLYERVRTNKKWGSAQWCMVRRGRQPQPPVKKAMIEDGAWLPEFDSLIPYGE